MKRKRRTITNGTDYENLLINTTDNIDFLHGFNHSLIDLIQINTISIIKVGDFNTGLGHNYRLSDNFLEYSSI